MIEIDQKNFRSGKQSLSITRTASDTLTSFTPVHVMVPMNFEAQQLTITCWLKTEDVKGRGQFYFLIKNSEGDVLHRNNIPAFELNGTTDWKQYTTSIALDEGTDSLELGFLLVGTGKIWADDFRILLDNRDISKFTPAIRKTVPAMLDNKEFAKGSGINLQSVTTTQKEDLSILAKIWGFVKYYHPFIAAGNLNWDYELFRFLPSYLNVTTTNERNELLLRWLNNKLGRPQICSSCSEKLLETATYKPDLDWISDKKTLGDSLSSALEYIRYNRNLGKPYYMNLVPGVRNPRIVHEPAYTQFTYPDAGYRLLALFRYWNIIQYWFPDKYLIGEDWKDILPEFIPKMVEAANATEYVVTVRRLIARIHDTHANIWGSNRLLDSLRGKFYPPFKIRFVGDTAVVAMAHDTAFIGGNILAGDIITSIDGKKVSDIIKNKLPDLPASNYPTQLRDLAGTLLRSNDSIATVTINRNGQSIQTGFKRRDARAANLWKFYFDYPYQRDSSFFFIEPGIGYINLGKIKKKQVDSVFRALEGSKGVIIDNRQYPGDFPITEIGDELMPESTPFVKFPSGNLSYPGLFTTNAPQSIGKRNKNYYKGRVIILVNENSQSSAEFHTMAFRVAPGALVVGSTTAGADGNVSGLYLPGGIYTMFSGIGVHYPDGRETQRVGIIPDVIVKPTVKGIRLGRDELMEKAVELILK